MELSNKKSTPASKAISKRFDEQNDRFLFDKKRRDSFSLLALWLVTILFISGFMKEARAERIEILMSNVTTQQEDAYLCTSYKFTDDQNYITNVEPLTNANVAHHMFAFGCDKPASSSLSWNCGDLVCQGQKTILYAWGRNAPSLVLPDGN